VLELGMVPTTGSFSDAALHAVGEQVSPLVLVFCLDCALVQTLPGIPVHEGADAERREPVTKDDRADLLALVSPRPLGSRSLVVEIGSGDGARLRELAASGVTVLGIERSTGAAFSAAAAGVPTITDAFDRDLATKLRAGGLHADVIVVSRVIDQVDDLNRFVEGLRILVADHGAVVVDTPYVFDILDRVAVGAVRHDRRSYFSCTSLDALFRQHGLFLNDVQVPSNGPLTRLRCLVEPREAISDRCENLLSAERERRVAEISCYIQLQPQVSGVLDDLGALLRTLRSGGHSIAAYGADPDVVTLLNAGGFGRELIDVVVERDPLARGMRIPGVRIPIVTPDVFRRGRSDFLLVLGPPSDDALGADEAAFVCDGGRLIVLQPSPRIVAATR
jgi:hypothetical protein